jgi:hypothetical protein
MKISNEQKLLTFQLTAKISDAYREREVNRAQTKGFQVAKDIINRTASTDLSEPLKWELARMVGSEVADYIRKTPTPGSPSCVEMVVMGSFGVLRDVAKWCYDIEAEETLSETLTKAS